MTNTRITLGADVGGTAAHQATNACILELRKLLTTSQGPHSDDVDELAIVLRIDGDVTAWGFEGADKLRLARKQRYVTVDIGVPQARWADEAGFRTYLALQARSGLEAMIARLKSAGLDFKEAPFWRSVDDVLREFQGRAR